MVAEGCGSCSFTGAEGSPSRRHLESVLGGYIGRYNEARPHRGSSLVTSLPRLEQPGDGEIDHREILGGFIHECLQAA